jgi:hypothetical protein
MFSMSDATGVTAGGISDVFTVGAASAGSSSCNITDPGELNEEVLNFGYSRYLQAWISFIPLILNSCSASELSSV